MTKPVIKIENLSKVYRLGEVGTGTLSHDLNRFWQMNILGKDDPYAKVGQLNDRTKKAEKGELISALQDINLEVQQGEVLGIIGKNGAGKSTLLKLLSRVTSPTTGTIKVKGRLASLLEVGTGFNPEMTGRENIYMNGTIMGMRKWEIDRKLDEIVEFAGVAKYLDTPTKRYSSGMTVRLGFAIAAHLEPEILVVDEVLAVGDAEFQKKAIGKMQDVSTNDGRTVLFVSHNMGAIRSLCEKGLVLENGSIAFYGDVQTSILKYQSIYSTNDINKLNIKYYNNNFRLNEILFNNKKIKTIQLTDNNDILDVLLKGYISETKKIALEIKLVDANDQVIAFYSPCHHSGITEEHLQGEFSIYNKIQIPKGITKGTFYLDIFLTNPKIEYYFECKRALKIETQGTPTETGFVFEYSKGHGLLFLK